MTVWSFIHHTLKITTEKQKPLKWTDRTAPFLPGLYSLQAVSCNEEPDITAYRMSPDDAINCKRSMAAMGSYGCLLMRDTAESWDVYDGDGEFIEKSSDVIQNQVGEVMDHVEVNREDLVREARETLLNDDLSLIACAEHHAGASSADHSNFVVVCRRMIIDAKPHDMQHIYIVESKQWPCRVTGIFADVNCLSSDMQDVFLDRVKWLNKSWPLLKHHHLEMLADRMAKTRPRYVSDLLADCGRAAGLSPDLILGMQSTWAIASPGAKYRFAHHLVTALQSGLMFYPGQVEEFDPDVVERYGKVVVDNYRSILR